MISDGDWNCVGSARHGFVLLWTRTGPGPGTVRGVSASAANENEMVVRRDAFSLLPRGARHLVPSLVATAGPTTTHATAVNERGDSQDSGAVFVPRGGVGVLAREQFPRKLARLAQGQVNLLHEARGSSRGLINQQVERVWNESAP